MTNAQSRSPAACRRGFVRARAPRLSLALTAAMLCPAALACAGKPTRPATARAAAATACAKTRYLLTVNPSTIVSNELHQLHVQALLDSCGHQTAVRHASVRLLSDRATTNYRGRCTLDVRLQTGRYRVRLYVHGHRVARAPVSAIPVVAH